MIYCTVSDRPAIGQVVHYKLCRAAGGEEGMLRVQEFRHSGGEMWQVYGDRISGISGTPSRSPHSKPVLEGF